ncbi:MAG: PDZ domain-containing protein, partial [Proteobacteria bacterium]|nr:PDZ domain-containing protein [Pseudomonadota bacterium]
GLAGAVFGLDVPVAAEAPWRPRLGVMIRTVEGVLRVLEVVAGSVAEVAGIKADDEIISAAGVVIVEAGDLVAVIGRQAPGTWLPLTLNRGGESRDVVAKFHGTP